MSLSLNRRGPLVAVMAMWVGIVALLVGALGPVSEARAVGNCPNEAFRVGPSSELPDCRAFEMVSPPDKNGGEVDGGIHIGELAAPEQAAADGEAATYGSTSAFTEAEPESADLTSQYISARTADGWRTRAIVPTQEIPEGKALTAAGAPYYSPYQGFSESLEDGFLLAWNPQPDPSAPAGYFNPYLRDDGSGGYQLLSEVTPPVQPPGQVQLPYYGFGVVYAGMSADGQHVIFEANDALTPGAIPGRVNLYEWSAGQPLELVSVLPEGTVDTAGSEQALAEGSLRFGSPIYGLGGGADELPYNFSGALSSNGKRAFWTGGGGAYQVYMHEITESGARTVEVSASQKEGVPSGKAPAQYWTANAEGTLVYFTSDVELTNDSTAGAGADLYQYNVNTGRLSDLTVDPHTGEAANVQGVLGMGESDGVPSVYFVARGVLAQGASAGVENLYLWRSSASAPTFIATLGESEGELIDFTEAVMERTSRVSPDGQLLAFQSAEPLTGYDNAPADGQSCQGRVLEGRFNPYTKGRARCMEVFEYNAQTNSLVCASCDPRRLPPTADSLVPETLHLYENVRGWESSTVQQRYLLDDGRLFFQSADPLLPQASDGRQNIYEYEPEGVGQCAASGSGSCLYLISTGSSSADSYFADASADGRDVFLLTRQQLVPQDGDGAVDMYDAREDGGFSSAQPPPCAGEACKPAVTPAPAIYGAPSSATFEGAGNLPSQPTIKAATTKKRSKKKSAKKKTKKKSRKHKKFGSTQKSGRSESGRR
jgi:hypothetical protein